MGAQISRSSGDAWFGRAMAYTYALALVIACLLAPSRAQAQVQTFFVVVPETLQSEEREALLDAIGRLSEERRNLLQYKFGTTLSNLEIGEMMNKSESAIKSLYFRTLSALRQDLESRGWGGGDTPATDAKLLQEREDVTRTSAA